jgi:hypothetical protein
MSGRKMSAESWVKSLSLLLRRSFEAVARVK